MIRPIYQQFVDQAKALEPRFLSMVIPSLDGRRARAYEFRATMLGDQHTRVLVDYPNA